MIEILVFLVSFVSLILSIIIMATSAKLKSDTNPLTVNRAETIYNSGTGLLFISLVITAVSGFKVFGKRKEYLS